MKNNTLTPAQMNILEALRNGAKIERRSKTSKVGGHICSVDLGRFLVTADGKATRLNENCDILPALIIWDEEMKATSPEWHLVAHVSTRRTYDADATRERGWFMGRLDNLLEKSTDFRKKDKAIQSTLIVRFPNGMTIHFRNEKGVGFATHFGPYSAT